MTEIINLNKIRKAKKKQKEIETAQQNRVIHGISTKARKLEKARQDLSDKKLDQLRVKPAKTIKGVDEKQ